MPVCKSRTYEVATRYRAARLRPRMLGESPAPETEVTEPAEATSPLEDIVGVGAMEEAEATSPLEGIVDVGEQGEETAVLDDNGEVVEPCAPPQYVLNAEAIAEARQKFKTHETDSGSPEFQIATLSTRISYLTTHLKANPKDHSSTRGLLKMVSTRRKLLKYLKREDEQRFNNIISGLNIRVSQQLRQL